MVRSGFRSTRLMVLPSLMSAFPPTHHRPEPLPPAPQLPVAHPLPNGKANRPQTQRVFRDNSLAPSQLRIGPPDSKVLAGPNAPSGWQGGLPLAYHIGPGPAEVSISVAMDYEIRPIWNVIATIKGSESSPIAGLWSATTRRLGLWRGRSLAAAPPPRSRCARALGAAVQKRLEAQAIARLRKLGRGRIRPGRLDRMGRGPRQGARRKVVLHAQRRFRSQRPRARSRRRSLLPRPHARSRRRPHRPAHGQVDQRRCGSRNQRCGLGSPRRALDS